MKAVDVPPPARDWPAALQQHRDAAMAIVASAAAVPAAEWNRPVAQGKWSPAQIAEHVRLTTAALRHEIETGEAMRVRTSWWQQLVARTIYLRRILSSATFPPGARAVREIQPGDGPFEQESTTQTLDDELRRFERALADRPRAHLTHPIFGVADARTGLRFCVVHLWHHRAQIEQRERHGE